jgi:shikimate dehydrogenase
MKSRIEMIGSPISHVRTPSRLLRLFEQTGERIKVTVREVGKAELPGYMAEAKRDDGLAGLIVTMPVKSLICPHLERQTELVQLIGSSNCVRLHASGSLGANFDGIGCVRALKDSGHDLVGKNVFLCGCGGAGKSIAASVASSGARSLAISDPAIDETSAFARRLRQVRPNCTISLHEPGTQQYDVVVNASPVGMTYGDPSPVPRDIVAGCEVVMDIALHPPIESVLSRYARELGKAFVDGVLMVEAQTALFRAFLLSNVDSEDEAIRIAARAG